MYTTYMYTGILQCVQGCLPWEGAGVGVRQPEGSHGREGRPGGHWLVGGAPLEGGGVSEMGECEPVDVMAGARGGEELRHGALWGGVGGREWGKAGEEGGTEEGSRKGAHILHLL